jgi:hypothetical protein
MAEFDRSADATFVTSAERRLPGGSAVEAAER